MSNRLGAQQEAIIRGPFEGRNAESIQKNFEKIFRRLKQFDAGLLGVPQDAADGDLVYFEDGAWKSLAIGTSGQAVRVVSGLPAWDDLPTLEPDYMGLVAQNQWAWFGRATPLAVGTPNPTVTGTSALSNQTDSTYASQTTAGGAGSGAALIGVAGACQLQHDPTFNIFIRSGAAITTQRLFFGLTNANFTNADTPGGASQYVAFRYSTPLPDSGWVGITRDGATPNTTAQVAAIAAATRYKLTIRVSGTGTTVNFSVNDGAEISTSSNLPAITTDLLPYLGIFSTGVPATAWLFSRCHCRYGS